MQTSDGGVLCNPTQVSFRADAAGALKQHQGPNEKHEGSAHPAGQALSGSASEDALECFFKVCELTVHSRGLTRQS